MTTLHELEERILRLEKQNRELKRARKGLIVEPALNILGQNTRIDGNLYLGGNAVGVWQDWTPTWTAATTNPTIGDGTIWGKYCVIGELVFYTMRIIAGSTTTFGTGNWSISLPVPSYIQPTAQDQIAGSGYLRDNSTSTNYIIVPMVPRWASIMNSFYSAGSTVLDATTPFTWGSSDRLYISVIYQKAA